MMKEIKVSVIIPVYNAGVLLHDCVKSLINQTLEECEFIFVNDGSSDDSKQVLENYQLQDSRIILINQENKGISIARNTGISASRGAYIGFMDNDDFVKADMFENLYKAAISQDLDIVVSNTILGRDGKYIIKDYVFPVNIVYDEKFINEFIMPNLLKVEDLFAVWNKLYKRDLIISNNIGFPCNRIIEEDNMFNLQSFNKAKKVIFIDYSGYFYREVASSESRKLIELDYFKKALEKYHFDYIKEYDLKISYAEMEKLQGIRLIHKVIFYTFKCGIDKIKLKDKYNYIKKMMFNDEVYNISKKYKNEILEGKGRFENIIINIIFNKSYIKLYLLLAFLGMFYSKKMSEFLRFVNKSHVKTLEVIKKEE